MLDISHGFLTAIRCDEGSELQCWILFYLEWFNFMLCFLPSISCRFSVLRWNHTCIIHRKMGERSSIEKWSHPRENSSDEVECFAWQLRMLTFLTSRFRREIFWSLVGYPNHTKGRLVDGQGINMLPYKKVCGCWMLTLFFKYFYMTFTKGIKIPHKQLVPFSKQGQITVVR